MFLHPCAPHHANRLPLTPEVPSSLYGSCSPDPPALLFLTPWTAASVLAVLMRAPLSRRGVPACVGPFLFPAERCSGVGIRPVWAQAGGGLTLLTRVCVSLQRLQSGTTGVCALIAGNTLHVAWLGDSQVLLVQQGQAVRLMEPHRPERQVRGPRPPGGSGCSSRGRAPRLAPAGPLKLGALAARNLTEPSLSRRHGAQSCRTELGVCWQAAREAGLTRSPLLHRRGAPGCGGGLRQGWRRVRARRGPAWGPRAAGREEVLGTQTEPEEAEPEPAAGAACWVAGEQERLLLRGRMRLAGSLAASGTVGPAEGKLWAGLRGRHRAAVGRAFP